MAEDLSEADRIEQDLARTRERMDGRLDALQEKMSPTQLLNDAFSYFRGGQGADFASDLISRAKANPLPAALIGAGVVWLIASSSRTQTTHDLGQRLGQGSAKFQEGTQTMTRTVRSAIPTSTPGPLILGGVAAIVGLVVGSLIPTLAEEEHLLGSAAGKLRESGRDAVQDIADRGSKVVSETLGAVKDSAEQHGLTTDTSIDEVAQGIKSGDLLNQAGQVAHETLQTGQQSAQAQFGSGKPDQS